MAVLLIYSQKPGFIVLLPASHQTKQWTKNLDFDMLSAILLVFKVNCNVVYRSTHSINGHSSNIMEDLVWL